MLDFVGIGAQKTGTTWLYEWLKQHPEIHFPYVKEISFWSAHYPQSLENPRYRKNMDWYRGIFNHWDEETLKNNPIKRETLVYRRNWFDHIMAWMDRSSKLTGNDHTPLQWQPPKIKLGEISPTYCYFENAGVLPVIREFAPDLRIIYIIRHPFDRAWSSAQMAVKRAEMKPDEASDQWYIDHFRSYLGQKYGDYIHAIHDWCAVFPKEQFLLLKYEDILVKPVEILHQCCSHIGVKDADYFSRLPAEKIAQKIFAGSGAKLRPSLLPVLHELHDEKITLLKQDYGIDYTTYPVPELEQAA